MSFFVSKVLSSKWSKPIYQVQEQTNLKEGFFWHKFIEKVILSLFLFWMSNVKKIQKNMIQLLSVCRCNSHGDSTSGLTDSSDWCSGQQFAGSDISTHHWTVNIIGRGQSPLRVNHCEGCGHYVVGTSRLYHRNVCRNPRNRKRFMTCEITCINYCDKAFILCTYSKNMMSLQIFMFIVLSLLKTCSYIYTIS